MPAQVGEVLREFAELMPDELPKELPPRRAHDHRIELEPGARPPAKAPYRMGPAELTELRAQLDELLAAGLIQPSRAPYGAPVLFQRKKDGSLRMCVDYRALNKVTVKNRYPVPNAADLFDRLYKAEYFSKLDLRSGYWQVRIAPGDESKTTCVTRYGSFEFLVMPFGLTNAPATFCNLMTDVLYDFLDDFVVVYLDDIVIYSSGLEQHVEHLRRVLQRLREHRLYVKREKCEFARTEVHFLGHIVGHGAIRMDSAKVRAIQDWPTPATVSELRSFLGLANYYRRFIKGYSTIASPLTDLLKKEQRWSWSSTCEEAFDKLKTALATEPVLQLPRFEDPFEVHTDASDRALGGVLVQAGHPVAYESRKFKDAETRYSAHEKEMTAVIHCLEVWRHYLLGTKFKIVTDNVANTYFKTQRKLTPKQARWQEYLAEFDFDWEHRPGRQNQVADALSRQANQEFVAAVATMQTDMTERIREAAQTDAAYAKLMRDVTSGLVRRFWIQDGLLRAQGGRLVVPKNEALRRDLLKESHDSRWAGHPGMERMYALLSRDFYWPNMWRDVEAYVRSCLICQMDKVERKRPAGLLQPLPIPERPWASVSMDFIAGFPEVDGRKTIFVVVDRFSKYAIFMVVPEPCTAETCASLFFTHVVKFFGIPGDIISDRDTRFTGKFWTTLFLIVGTELKFSTAFHPQTDGQTERVNALLEEYLRHFVTARQRNWLELLDAAQFSYNLNRSSATDQSPAELCLGYQPRTPLEVARQYDGPCPAAHLFARDRTENMAKARDSLAQAAMRMKLRADEHRRPVEFQVGDLVMLKITPYLWKKATKQKQHKGLLPRYDGPFKVLRRVGEVAYKLALPARLRIHPVFHVSFLKPYHGDLDAEQLENPGRMRPAVRPRFARKIARILADRKVGTSQGPQYTEYLVQWHGEDASDATWRWVEELWQFEDDILAYTRASATGTSAPSGGGGLSPPQ